MSLSTNSERSDHQPPTLAGLRSPLYGTATFTSLSPSSSPALLSSSVVSSSRLSYPSRSVTPPGSDDGLRMRRVAISPAASSYDSRRHSDTMTDPDMETYAEDNDNSIDETAEVEEVLSRTGDEVSISRGDNWSSGYSSSGYSSAYDPGSTSSYATATEPLDFDRERRVLSTISERTESQSINSGAGTGAGIFQNLFSSTFSRPTSLFSSAARSFYGAPVSPLSPPSSIPTLQGARPATPERMFRPAPPTGKRVGNLIASFESSASESDISSSGYSRPGSAPLGPRSPSPYSTRSRSTSPLKHSRSGSTGIGLGLGLSATSGAPQSLSCFLSPPAHTSTFSRSTPSDAVTERPRSPLSSVRNIVAAWKERSPEKNSAASRSMASASVVSGPSLTNTSASSTRFGFGGGFFSLRRRATLTAASSSAQGSGISNSTPPSYDDFGTESVTDSQSLGRSNSQRSAGAGSVFDITELGSFVRGSREPLRVGQLWYLNVHAPPPFRWQRCRAILYPNTLLLSWIAPGGGRGVVTLDLVNCNEVRSVQSPSHPSARDDIGTVAARLQMDERLADSDDLGDYDLVEMLCPFQLLYSDGVERIGAESARERVRWVSAIWEALDRSAGPPDRSMTRSPTGSIRTIRSITSSVISSGSGSASTTYLPPMDSIPDLPDFETMTFTQTQSPRHSLSSFTSISRTRASDDGAISSRGGLLHPLDSRSIEIAPSRSSSLRRTSSLADLDAEFASALSASGISFDSRTHSRGGSSRFSARWTREPSEHSSSVGSLEVPESVRASGLTGLMRRMRASTLYSQSASSQPTQQALDSASSTMTPTYGLRSPSGSDSATQVVPSTLSLRRTASNSMLGDSHSGPTTTMDTRSRSPTTPTRTSRSPELYTTTSGAGLSRASAVRRRTPRATRTYSGSTRSGVTQSSSDKENENEEIATTGSWNACETSQWSSLESRSYTTESYDHSRLATTTTRTVTSIRALSESGDSTVQQRAGSEPAGMKSEENESEEDIFITPTPSARTATSYHSMPGTPTPSIPSLFSTEYETALKASSTEYATADVCPTEPPSTEYITAEICPSTPPATETEYLTAECRCKPTELVEPVEPSLAEIGTLTPSLSLTYLPSEKPVEDEVASLYAPSTVPTIPSTIEEAAIPLPESESEESPPRSVVELEMAPSVSIREPAMPSPESTALRSSTVPPTPVVEPPTPSLLTTVPSTTVSSTTAEATTSLTSSSVSSIAPLPSSASSPSVASIPLSPSSPSSPTSASFRSDSSKTPKSKSLYVPSHSSAKSVPSVSDGYESSFLAPSPSLHSIPFLDPVDASFETSFMRPSELYSDQMPSPFMLKDLSAISTTVTPTSTTTNSTSSIGQTSSIEQMLSRSSIEAPLQSLSTITSASSMTPSSEETLSISSLTPSSATPSQTVSGDGRTATPSSLTPSSFMHMRSASSVGQSAVPSSLTPSSSVDIRSMSSFMHTRSASSVGQSAVPSSLTPSSSVDIRSMSSAGQSTVPSSLTESSFMEMQSASSAAQTSAPSSLTPGSAFDDESILGHTVTVTRTPSSVSSISTASISSSVFTSRSLYEETATIPTLLSSRATTPRPMTPAVPLPSSPSLSFSSATPTVSLSIGTPRSDARSLHTLTSVVTSDVIEQPREEILTHDVNRLLRYLHDLDQIRGEETQDMKEHLQRIEDELRDLADFLRRPEIPMKDQSVDGSIRLSRSRPLDPASVHRRSLTSESLEYVSDVAEQVAQTTPKPLSREQTPASQGQRPLTSGSTSPLPVPEPRPRSERALPPQTPSIRSVRSLTPPPRMPSPSYSPSTLSEGMSFLSSHHSDDFSLMSLEDYPTVPLRMPGSPSSPSDSSWSSSSSDATLPPTSVTPSSDPRRSMLTGPEFMPEDLTPESPFPAATPIPAASLLASLVSAESPLPLPPDSMTPSQPSATPLPASPFGVASISASPLPASTPLVSSSRLSATPPPSSSTPSSLPPSSPTPPPAVPIRHPTSPVLSLSPEPSEPTLPLSPPSPRSAVFLASPTPSGSEVRPRSASPTSPALPIPPAMPGTPVFPVPQVPEAPPSPVESIITVRPPSDRSGRSRALDGLRDLLEDLRGQTQALWDGQLATNRMLDDLVARRPTAVPVPEGSQEEINDRLRNIEGLLDGILQDLARGGLEPAAEREPSEISSDTSSALRRYIDRLRDSRRHEPLHMPTPVRAPPAHLDTEWLNFLSGPLPTTEQHIQGPPPLVPLVRRSARRPRVDSVSPPPSIPTPVIRTHSVPLDESIRFADEPPIRGRDMRRQPWTWPRLEQGVRRPAVPSESGRLYDVPGTEEWRTPRPRPQRPLDDLDVDFLREVHRRRRMRDPQRDGFVDVTQQPELGQEQPATFEEVPPAPPRVHTAPPDEHIPGTWYRTPVPPRPRPEQMMADASTEVPGMPTAPPPQPVQTTYIPEAPMPVAEGVVAGAPFGGPPPPFNEMLDLLRQNRLAQTASIDQQREIMRYMRGLNQWLEHDVRDRQNEMRSIGARVDALRAELGRLGFPAGVPFPVPVPPAGPGQLQGQPGQTFIVPPLPQPQPGFVMPPAGQPVMPLGPMPQPQVPFTPAAPFGPHLTGTGPPVVPPLMPMFPRDELVTPGGGFIPPRPEMRGTPVIPDFNHFPRPGMRRPPSEEYEDRRPEHIEPFIPPRPPPSPMMPVPPPPGGFGAPITVMPPMHRVESSGSSSPSRSSGSSSPSRPEIHIHVPSPPQPAVLVPSSQAPPPEVVRMDQGRVPSGPLHPDLASMYPTALPQPPPSLPIVIAPPAPGPTAPTAFPDEYRTHSPVIIHTSAGRSRSRSPERRPSQVVVVPTSRRSRSRSSGSRTPPTRVIVQSDFPRSHRSRDRSRSRSHSPHVHRAETQRSRASDRHRRRSYSRSHSRSPERRRRFHERRDDDRSRRSPSYSPRRPHEYRDDDRGRPRSRSRSPAAVPVVIHTESGRRRSHSPPPILVRSEAPQPPILVAPHSRSHSRSSSRSRTPIIVQQPMPFEPIQAQTPVPPIMIAPGPVPDQQPTVLPLPPMPSSYVPDIGPSHYPSRYSPSPPPVPPQAVGTQPIIIQQPSTRLQRSPSRYEDDRGRRPTDGGRSRYGSPQRRRSRSRDEGDRPSRRPGRRSPSYDEADPHGPRSRLQRSRSPVYPEEGRRGEYSPRHRPHSHRSRSPTEIPYSPSGRSRLRDDRGRERGRRSRSDDDRRSPRRLGRRPRASRSPSPVYTEGDVGGARPGRTPTHPSRVSRRPSLEHAEGDPRLRPAPTQVSRVSRRPSREYVEGDVGEPVRLPAVRRSSMSPTRVIVQSTAPPETVVIRPPPPTGPPYVPPESVHTMSASPPRRRPTVEADAPQRPYRVPSRPPTVVPISGRASPQPTEYREEYEAPPAGEYGPPVSEGRPVRPPGIGTIIRSTKSDTEPIIPYIPQPHEGFVPHREGYMPPIQQLPPASVISEVPVVHRIPHSPSPVRVHPQVPSGPGDLALHEALQAHQERLEEQERRLEELGRAALEAEDRREQFFRDHEEVRDRLFQENEERRERELAELRDELHQKMEECANLPVFPPVATEEPPEALDLPETSGALPVGGPESVGGTELVSETASTAESARPVPPPGQVVLAEPMPQLQEILDLLRAQQADCADAKVAEAERFDALRDEIDQARAEAKQECEERIRMLEEELARTREELELEKGQRKTEELERIERERADVIERDEAMRAQLGDITTIVQEQREECARKRELMDERWEEKQMRREHKQARSDAMYEMLERVLQEREQERAEREQERQLAAQRPSIETVLEELKRQNDAQIELINNLTGTWRADSARQHQETIDAVRASAQEMVPYNLTGYLDEFSKALAGEIRTLLGEVGRLHEQKRTLQFEIGSLMHMHSQYGLGGQFEPDWRPTMGPLAPPPPPGPGDMPPGGPPGPPGPDEPPPPAKPAWRTVQQRAPRRKRTGKGEAMPASTLAPPEPVQERQPSWATWQPNPSFAPTPPPPGASPLVVPPQGPTGLFGPRSPRNTMYAD